MDKFLQEIHKHELLEKADEILREEPLTFGIGAGVAAVSGLAAGYAMTYFNKKRAISKCSKQNRCDRFSGKYKTLCREKCWLLFLKKNADKVSSQIPKIKDEKKKKRAIAFLTSLKKKIKEVEDRIKKLQAEIKNSK
jgi:hypothetical protein